MIVVRNDIHAPYLKGIVIIQENTDLVCTYVDIKQRQSQTVVYDIL